MIFLKSFLSVFNLLLRNIWVFSTNILYTTEPFFSIEENTLSMFNSNLLNIAWCFLTSSRRFRYSSLSRPLKCSLTYSGRRVVIVSAQENFALNSDAIMLASLTLSSKSLSRTSILCSESASLYSLIKPRSFVKLKFGFALLIPSSIFSLANNLISFLISPLFSETYSSLSIALKMSMFFLVIPTGMSFWQIVICFCFKSVKFLKLSIFLSPFI